VVADHDGAGGEISQALVATMQQHRERRGQEQGGVFTRPDQVAEGRRSQRDRAPRIHHHPNSQQDLARRAAAVQALEQDIVREQREAQQEVDQRAGPPSQRGLESQLVGRDLERHEEQREQEEVCHRRGRPRAQPRQLEPDLHVLRSFHPMLLTQIGRAGRDRDSRGRSHVLILSLSPEGASVDADLRPMGVGEILDGALTIYRRHFITFLALGVIVLWLPVVLTIYAQLSGPQQHPLILLLAAIMQYFAGLLLTAGVIRVISDFYLGREASLTQALGSARKKSGRCS